PTSCVLRRSRRLYCISYQHPQPPHLHSFPTRRSSDLQQSTKPKLPAKKAVVAALQQLQQLTTRTPESVIGIEPNEGGWRVTDSGDRKSTRLNSSHVSISYAVFCLKKKSNDRPRTGAHE